VDWENRTGLESRPSFNPFFDTRAAAEGTMHAKTSDKNVTFTYGKYNSVPTGCL